MYLRIKAKDYIEKALNKYEKLGKAKTELKEITQIHGKTVNGETIITKEIIIEINNRTFWRLPIPIKSSEFIKIPRRVFAYENLLERLLLMAFSASCKQIIDIEKQR